MDCERPKGKTVTIVGATGRMDAHIHACDIDLTSAVAARLVVTKRGDNVAGIGKPLKPAGDGGTPGQHFGIFFSVPKPRLRAAEWRQSIRRPNP